MVRLARPDTAADWNDARRLVEAYAASLDIDLSFQNFADEIEHLATEYGPPTGAFLLAEANGRRVGCVGLRGFSDATGEVKRLYVEPSARGLGAGRALASGIVTVAREIGYTRLVLDTLPSMGEAQALYRSLGFEPIPPYRFNPVPGTVFMEVHL
jgi:ribosomal protein S18 acetylase RimI-like enzyme